MLFKRNQSANSHDSSDGHGTNEEGLLPLAGFSSGSKGDVIFVHGLRGNPLGTWHPNEKNLTLEQLRQATDFFPFWLSQDFPSLCVWSYGYQAEPSNWTGLTMALFDRASNLLSTLKDHELGQRPLIFVTHSLGGLVVKKTIQNAHSTPGNLENQELITHTKGVVFIATPHTGSHLASTLNYWLGGLGQSTVTATELEDSNPSLRELNDWYRFNSEKFGIDARVFFETKPSAGLVGVVTPASANPGLSDQVEVTPIPNDHITIAKPSSQDSSVYRGVKRFIKKNLESSSMIPLPKLYSSSVEETQESLSVEQKQSQSQDFDRRRTQLEANEGLLELASSDAKILRSEIAQRGERIAEIEAQIRVDQSIKEALAWLSDDRGLAERYGRMALNKFSGFDQEMQADSSRLDDFYWELQMYLRQLCASLRNRKSKLTQGYKILSEPRLPKSLPNSDAHIEALELVKENIPPYIPNEVKIDLTARIDYVKNKLRHSS